MGHGEGSGTGGRARRARRKKTAEDRGQRTVMPAAEGRGHGEKSEKGGKSEKGFSGYGLLVMGDGNDL